MSSNSEKTDPGQSCEFQENLNILRQIPVFSPLPLDSLKVFAYLCNRETFREGEYLFRQDEDDGQAYYIISGSAVILYEGSTAEQEIGGRGPGSFIGGLALHGKMPRLFSSKATSDVTCLILTRSKFAKAMEQFPELVPKILHALVGRINDWERKMLAGHAKDCPDCFQKSGVSLI